MARRAAGALSQSFPLPTQQHQQQDEEEAAALSISDQRTLYLVNIFIGNTARFLNSFSFICEDKLSQLHRRLLHLDATLTLLEAKLEGTCPYQEFDDDSFEENEEAASSLPLGNDIVVDTQSEYGESSGQASNIKKIGALAKNNTGWITWLTFNKTNKKVPAVHADHH